MTAFGDQLRKFRQRCNTPGSRQGKLTQEMFGQLVGARLGIHGYTGAAVSDWERGKTRLHADDRPLLMALIKVLHDHEGIRTLDEANQLLEAGNFRPLAPQEAEKIFGTASSDIAAEQSGPGHKTSKPITRSLIGDLLAIPEGELQKMIAAAEAGPPPSWPRLFVALIHRFTARVSVFQVLKFVLWIWVGVLAWVLIAPSLRWPFSNSAQALFAVAIYAAGSILVPAWIGAMTNTKDNEFWREQRDVSDLNLRLYTHQGASIGFHLGYFFVFMTSLLLYSFGWGSMAWIGLGAATLPVVLGYAGARLVPYNLFAAFRRLSLKDGRIFFIFVLLGPAWGYFFLEIYDILLTRSLGIFVVLSSLTILLAMMAWRYRRSGTTMIPLRWWIMFWISFLLCELLLLWLRQVV